MEVEYQRRCGYLLAMVVNQATLFAESDLEVENRLVGWTMPVLWAPVTPGTTPPPIGTRCSTCSTAAFWTEAPPRRQWAWRCIGCHPPARPETELIIVET